MPKTIRAISGAVLAAPAALALLLAGCDSSTGPRPATPAQFSREITLPDFQNHLTTGAARVEVSVVPGGLTARKVEIQGADELAKREQIRSRVTAISTSGDQGTVTLELGGLQVGFTATTRFRPDDGDGSGGDMALADFVARIQAQLAAGRHPAVKARRSPPAQPQAPDDAGFVASELKLDHEADHPRLELNVTGANLLTNQTPPPDGWLKVLGLMIELRVTEGITRLRTELPGVEGEQEFEGFVTSVDAGGGTVTLESGTVIRIVAGTEIEPQEGSDDDHLASLADVAAALGAGRTVKAEGEGLVEAENPRTIVAIKVEFEVEDQRDH